jgi:DNA-binding IclR family transcriptional regulator
MTQLVKYYRNDTNTKSVSKTLSILSTFNEMSPMQRTSDIATKLHMNISTVSRHLNTMRDMGFLERDEETGLYYVGLEIVSLAGASLQNNAVFRHTYPELQQLSFKYDIHSHMGVPRGESVVHLISICCESTMELLIPMGHCHPMYCSAMGRAILAYMPPDEAQKILLSSELQRYTYQTKTDIHEINRELVHTRHNGYCLLIDELAEGKGSLAAPVFDRNRNPIAAVSVSASAYSLSQPKRERDLAKAVMSISNKISGKLGYYPK